MRNSGQGLTRMMIFEAVWGFHFDPGTNLIDVHIGRLRKKVDPPGIAPLILTVRGSGYPLAYACARRSATAVALVDDAPAADQWRIVRGLVPGAEIGSAPCRDRVCNSV